MKKDNASNERIEEAALKILKKNEQRRKIMSWVFGVIGVASLGYGLYYYYDQGSAQNNSDGLAERKEIVGHDDRELILNPDILEEVEEGQKNVLVEYKDLYKLNKNLIGWIKIADTIIDYPILQTSNNEFYLTHNYKQEKDKSGTLFLDYRCDYENPSDNLIVYGHNLKSERMFGSLKKYENEKYLKKHPIINFDTLYEKGSYQVVFVFESEVYQEKDVVFKYYDFIDAVSEQEFNSNIEAMREMSFYDIGIDVKYGDELLTLSTCDSAESNSRFVVVAKRIK